MALVMTVVVTGAHMLFGARGWVMEYAPVSAVEAIHEVPVYFFILFLLLYSIQIASRKSVLFQEPLGRGPDEKI